MDYHPEGDKEIDTHSNSLDTISTGAKIMVTYGLTLLLYKIQSFRSLSDLDFDLSRSLKVKSDGVF